MKPSKEAIRLLRKSKEVVRRAPDEMFYMAAFAKINGSQQDLLQLGAPTCGTAYCWGGWATAMPEMQEKGLRLMWWPAWDNRAVVMLGTTTGYEAISRAFGITFEQAIYIAKANVDIENGERIPITKAMLYRRIDRVIAGEID